MKPSSSVAAPPVSADSALTEALAGSSPVSGRSLDSRVLFAGGNELVIFHYGESYRLRETRQGKLILTK